MNSLIKAIKAWSWSRYAGYVQCPAKLKFSTIDKIKEPKSAAMQRGADVHDGIAAYLTMKASRLPAEIKNCGANFKELRTMWGRRMKLAATAMAPIIEDEWAFTSGWEQTGWKDWDNCVVRIKIDAGWWESPTRLRIRDWKTGKFSEGSSEEYMQQLELYALAALIIFPQLEEVVPDLFYVDQGVEYPPPQQKHVFTRADVPRLKKLWAKRIKPLLADRTFSPRPGWYCAGCYFNKSTEYGWGKNKQPKPAGPCKF